MSETWLFNNLPEGALLSLDEVVRVEFGPQTIELDCTPQYLSIIYTHANYRVGAFDAHGRMIVGDDPELMKKYPDGIKYGDRMRCVDWKAKFVPKLWKVYRWQMRLDLKPAQFGWLKIAQYEDFNDALEHGRKLRKEMSSDAIHY